MEFTAAIGLVADLLHISKTCFNFIVTVKQIYQSGEGSYIKTDLKQFTKSLETTLLKIEHDAAASIDPLLGLLCKQCREYAKELLRKLPNKPQNERSSKHGIIAIGFRVIKDMWSQKELEALHSKIRDTFDSLQMHFAIIRYDKPLTHTRFIDARH